MQSVLRSAKLLTRTLRAAPLVSSTPRYYASESYGSSQSGQELNKDMPNPTADREHPGPKAPADKGTTQSGQSQGSRSQSGSSTSTEWTPAIHQPGPPPENRDAEVEAHTRIWRNEVIEQRTSCMKRITK